MAKQKFLVTPTRGELLEWLSYDPETGIITRIKDPMGRYSYLGPITYTNGRNRMVCVCRRQYFLASRIIWRIMTGDDPGNMYVDHIDLDYTNDRWNNLRLATGSQQLANTPYGGRNKFGRRGVREYCGKYIARISFNRVRYSSAKFDTVEEAAKAYERMAVHHFKDYKYAPASTPP